MKQLHYGVRLTKSAESLSILALILPGKIINLIRESNLNIESTIAWEDSSAAQAFAKIGVKNRLRLPY